MLAQTALIHDKCLHMYMYMTVLLSDGYLNSSKVVQKSIQSCKDQVWLKRPLHDWC